MLHPVHPRHQTLRRAELRPDAERHEADQPRTVLDAVFARIDENLADL